MRYGWFLRSLHKWGATLMIASVILHQMRVYFTASYRKPRELNWLVGMCLLVCTLMVGFTGYSLVGEPMKRLLLGGDTYNESTLSRFFMLHAAILPAVMVLLLIVHVSLIRVQGVTEFVDTKNPEKDRGSFNFFPDHLLTEIIMGLVLMILLAALSTSLPATMGPRADPLVTPEVIKPEWFFYVSFRWLKLFSGTVAVLSMGLIVFTMFIWPFIDGAIHRRWPKSEFNIWIGILGVLSIIGLTIWEAVVAH